MKIGIIQTRGIGDIVIALPLAAYFIERGHEVYWPIDSRFIAAFEYAAPAIHFIPMATPPTGEVAKEMEYFLEGPRRILTDLGCDIVHCLYSFLTGVELGNDRLRQHLKFDEFKYAVANVPFAEKWRLNILRNMDREQDLVRRLQLNDGTPFIVVHDHGSDMRANIRFRPEIEASHRFVRIEELTDNFFDWLGVLESARAVLLIDSCFANLVEQLNMPMPKHLLLRSPGPATPVYKNGWIFH